MLNQTTAGNLGLSQVQYKAIEGHILEYQEKGLEKEMGDPSQIEGMEIDCKLNEIPAEVQTITQMPIILQQYLPTFGWKSDEIIQVGFNRMITTNRNSSYLYVINKDGSFLNYDGKYDQEGRLKGQDDLVSCRTQKDAVSSANYTLLLEYLFVG